MITTLPVLVVGTGNPGKFYEIKTILGDIPWVVHSLIEYQPGESPKESGDSYAANAILKAKFYASVTKQWVLADDSGLEVTALDGAPGLYSARYAGEFASDADRRALLLSEFKKSTLTDRSAQFVCAVAICTPVGSVAAVTNGICRGTLIDEARGNGGFGYDPLFQPLGYEQTFAELPNEIKNRISHRGMALLSAKEFLLTGADGINKEVNP